MPRFPSMLSLEFRSYGESVPEILDRLNAGDRLCRQKKILLKPNLVTAAPHPVTTHPDFCDAVISYIRSKTNADLIIAEGCGDDQYETHDIFSALGYTRLAQKHGIELVDLNFEPLIRLERPENAVFQEMYLPGIAMDTMIVSLPVLKAHSLATITGTLKNMMGFAPPEHYSGDYGIWKKAKFHQSMHTSIMDLNQFITPDLTILDASVGLAQYHLGGPACSPPVNRLVAGYDPLTVDREAATLLGFDWKQIQHLNDRHS